MKCAFCGALPKPDWDGFDLNWFQCGTMYPYVNPNYADQTPQCTEAERVRKSTRIVDANNPPTLGIAGVTHMVRKEHPPGWAMCAPGRVVEFVPDGALWDCVHCAVVQEAKP